MSKLRPPLPNTICDAHVSVTYAGKQPQVVRCKNTATVTLPPGGFRLHETWLCESCAAAIDARERKETP